MDTSVLKNFAQESRRYLMDVVSKKMEYYLMADNVEVRAKKHLVEELKKEISNSSKEQVIEKLLILGLTVSVRLDIWTLSNILSLVS